MSSLVIDVALRDKNLSNTKICMEEACGDDTRIDVACKGP